MIRNNSEQMPLCRPIKMTGDMGGEFVFILAESGGAVITEPSEESSLTIKPYPSDSTVWINSRKTGTGEQSFAQIQPGPYQVKVARDGYKTYEKRVTVGEGKAEELPVYLEKTEKPVIEPLESEQAAEEETSVTNSAGMEFV